MEVDASVRIDDQSMNSLRRIISSPEPNHVYPPRTTVIYPDKQKAKTNISFHRYAPIAGQLQFPQRMASDIATNGKRGVMGYGTDMPTDKPILIGSTKGGHFEQGKTVRLSANLKNTACYQWIKNGIPLPSCTGPTLEISNATLYNSGDYALIASNQFGIEITPSISVRII